MMVPLGIKPISPKPTVMVYAGPAGGLKPAAEGRTAAPIRFRRRAFNQPNAVGANRPRLIAKALELLVTAGTARCIAPHRDAAAAGGA